MEASKLGRIGDWIWFVAFGLVSSWWCVSAAGQLSATYDEPTYLHGGLQRWHTGSVRVLMRLGTMPLPVDVVTLPIYVWEQIRGERFDVSADFDQILPVARAAALFFWWLLLWYARLVGRNLAGPWGGRLAVAFIATEPSFLAHAGLATTDIAMTACLIALTYHFRTGRDMGWARRIAWPAFWMAAALLAKASALVFGPLCMLAVEVERLARSGAFQIEPGAGLWARLRRALASLRPIVRDGKWIMGGGLAGMMLYCGCDWQVEPTFVKWAHELPDGPTARVMVWTSENLRIFSNGAEGLIQQIKRNIRGTGVCLLGQTHYRALWYYFPVLLTIKLGLALLAAPLVVACCRPRALLNWAFLAGAFLILLSPGFRVQIGIRLVLPAVALVAIGSAAALALAWQSAGPGWRRYLVPGYCLAGLAWAGGAAVLVWPHYLCYTNELWGGTAAGYRVVNDSNCDWGQGLKELAQWQKEHAASPLTMWYFGTDPSQFRLPIRNVQFQGLTIKDADDLVRQVQGGYLAVSVSYLQTGDRCSEAQKLAAQFLRGQPPVARTMTFLIYDFTHLEGGAEEAESKKVLMND